MTPDELRLIGQSLYGMRWQSALARAIEVNRRTLNRWLSGKYTIKAAMAEDIRNLKSGQRQQSNHLTLKSDEEL